MTFLDTKHKRKSAVITAVILLLLFLGILNFGMRYLDPPEEYGLAINFGDSEFGSGTPLTGITENTSPNKIPQEQSTEPVKEIQNEEALDDVLTSDSSSELPVKEKIQEVEKTPVKEVAEVVEPKEVPKPKPSKETQDALRNLLKGKVSDGNPNGEGDTEIEGVQGNENGDVDTNKYYGNTGASDGGDYNLAGRKALSKPKRQPNCEEEGIVVVRITVDKSGKVMRAIPGVKGSTNTAACLLKPAKEAALSTIWNSDSNAPSKQTGTIIYKFSLSK